MDRRGVSSYGNTMRSEVIEGDRQHRRRMLVYRPSPDNLPASQRAEPEARLGSFPTASPGQRERRVGHRQRLPSSPLERRQKKVLMVALTDISKEVEIRHAGPRPDESPTTSECSKPTPEGKRDSPGYSFHLAPPTVLSLHTVTTPLAALSPPLYPSEPLRSPPKAQSWSLVPILHSVRSKLESFADIFLSPIKGRSGQGGTEESCCVHPGGEEPRCEVEGGEERKGRDVPGEKAPPAAQESQKEMEGRVWTSSAHSVEHTQTELAVSAVRLVTQPPTDRMFQQSPEELQHRTDGRSTGESSSSDSSSLTTTTSRSSMNIQLKMAVSALCRPPLQRRFSCPSLLLSPSSPSAGPRVAEESMDPALHPHRASYPYRRWHSLGTADEMKEMQLSTFSFTCLRKEKHPFLFSHAGGSRAHQQADNMRKSLHHGGQVSSQGPSVFGNVLRHQFLGGEHRVEDSAPEMKGKENSTISGKVSNFQIRKRPARHEGNLTPLGLPKRARLEKEEFSLEEIYTNKNYRTPTEKRTFETIFEEPVMRGGNLILTSQRPLRRLIVFRDSRVPPRRRRKKGRGGRGRRGDPRSTEKSLDLELLLENKLTQLDAALQGDDVPHAETF